MANSDLSMTLQEGVAETLAILTGLDLDYEPSQDRFHIIVRCINKATRSVALEHEWSYYSSVEQVGTVNPGEQRVELSSRLRARIIGDDAVRLVDPTGRIRAWAYLLPRDAIHKYADRDGIWACATRTTITFSRPFFDSEAGYTIQVPVMREPKQFELPPSGEAVSERELRKPIDFDYPDLVISRAAFIYAQTDPVMQPRVQTLEAQYKDIMYQLVERDDRATDSTYLNEFTVPIQANLNGPSWHGFGHHHPHSDERHH